MSNKRARVVVTIDITPFIEAFGLIAKAVVSAGRAIMALFTPVDPRTRYGWQENRTGGWISPICAAWVHEGCPLPEHCQCNCSHPPIPALVA